MKGYPEQRGTGKKSAHQHRRQKKSYFLLVPKQSQVLLSEIRMPVLFFPEVGLEFAFPTE